MFRRLATIRRASNVTARRAIARSCGMTLDGLEQRRLFAGVVFAQPTSITTGANPVGVASADVNADGKQDLLVASKSTSLPGFFVHLGNGQGGFGVGTRVATSYVPQSIVASDFDRDGKIEVAIGGQQLLGLSGGIQVVKSNGDGTFGAAKTYASGLGTTQVAVGDVNNDRIDDLLAVNPLGGTVAILTGNKNGTFNAAVQMSVGLTPTSITVGDYNEDGNLDLVVNSLTSVKLFRGKGNNTFAAATVFSFAQALSLQLTKIATVDLNNDGHADLIVPGLSGKVNTLIGKGDGTFASPQNALALPVQNSLVSLASDLNHDGASDLVTLDYSGGKLVIDTGATAADPAVQTVYNIGANPSSLDLIDINGDNILDLVATNSSDGTISLLKNLTTKIANGILDKVTRRLDIFGTDRTDKIELKEVGSQLLVGRDGIWSAYALRDFDFCYVNAGSGDDLVDATDTRMGYYISGGYGNDTVMGGLGKDTLFGSLGNDVLDGYSGNDRIRGWKGNDTLFGGEGDDKIYGEDGNDRIEGNSGRDTIWGMDGNDTLAGGQGNDKLYGGNGDDRLVGSIGINSLFGGLGKDQGDVKAGDIVDSIEVVIR